MQENTKHRSSKTIFACLILFGLICGLCSYIYVDFRKDAAEAESQAHLSDTLYKTSVRRLGVALAEENRLTSYHFAALAAEYAAGAGRHEAASFFRKISSGIVSGAQNMPDIAGAVNEYFESGIVPAGFSVTYASVESGAESSLDSEPPSVSKYRQAAALECASSIIGVDGLLQFAEKSSSGEFIFTCRNAYAVIDARSNTPLEAGASLPSGEARLSESACVSCAVDFINKYFPPDIASSARLISVTPDPSVYNLTYATPTKQIKISIKRDTGKVVKLVAR